VCVSGYAPGCVLRKSAQQAPPAKSWNLEEHGGAHKPRNSSGLNEADERALGRMADGLQAYLFSSLTAHKPHARPL
jgi:hypothetical protein